MAFYLLEFVMPRHVHTKVSAYMNKSLSSGAITRVTTTQEIRKEWRVHKEAWSLLFTEAVSNRNS